MPKPFLGTGYKPPAVIDPRNFVLEKAQAPVPYPASFKTDLSALPILMQEQIPDCVENSVVEVKKFHELQTTGVLYDLSRRSLAIPTVIADGAPFSDGTSLQVAMQIAHSKGIAESTYCPDNHDLTPAQFLNFSMLPSGTNNALTHTIQSYAFLSNISAAGLKNAIYQNGLVIIGLHIDQNWWTSPSGETSWAPTDILPLRPPAADSTTKSGHCVVLYGYDETYFYLVNWWSNEWGNKGYGYFGVNDIPTIWEAATIVDLTPPQIAAVKQAQSDVQQVQNVIPTIVPNSPSAPETVSLLEQAVQYIIKLIASSFPPTASAVAPTFMSNGLFKISLNQLGISAANAILTAVIVSIGGVVMTSGFDVFSANWASIGELAVNTAFITFIGFLLSELTSTNSGAVFGAIPFEK
jgi:hypothetical protein